MACAALTFTVLPAETLTVSLVSPVAVRAVVERLDVRAVAEPFIWSVRADVEATDVVQSV